MQQTYVDLIKTAPQFADLFHPTISCIPFSIILYVYANYLRVHHPPKQLRTHVRVFQYDEPLIQLSRARG